MSNEIGAPNGSAHEPIDMVVPEVSDVIGSVSSAKKSD